MEKNLKIILITLLLILLSILIWAPWLNNEKLHDKVLQEKGKVDGTINKNRELICDYSISWLPFGRYVTSCEAGYFITFYGAII